MARLVETPEDSPPATVTAWHAQAGAELSAGDPLVQLTGGDATSTIPSPVDGRLTHLLLGEGQETEAGTPLAIVDDSPEGDRTNPTEAAAVSGTTPATEPDTGLVLPNRSVTADVAPDFSGAVTAGSFVWPIDSSDEFDGGTAPSPVDLFLGGLASCLAVSIGVQADIRDVALSEISVDASATPNEGSVESIALRVRIETDAEGEPTADSGGDDAVDRDVLERIVTVGERTCHVAELLREDLPVELTWERV